jgi:DNA-binding SARP family transcriptional activator
VLTLLLLHANEVVPIDRLVDELWGDSPPESAANMLQGYVSHLRKLLEPGRGRGEHELLVSRPPGYVLRVDPNHLDAERFLRLASEGRRLLDAGDVKAAAERLRVALALWRGPALADVAYESFARPEVERLEELRLGVLEDRIDADLALGRHDILVGELRELVAGHPLRDRLRGQLMASLYRCGQQAGALEVYREGRRMLSEELGIEPGPALRELERSILRHDPVLGAPAAPPRPIVTRIRRRWPLLAAAAVLAGATLAAILALGDSGSARPVVVKPHSVAVVDPERNSVVADIAVGDYPGPLAADDTFVYVCNIGDATVSRVFAKSKKLFDTFSFSRAIELSAGGGHLWAANGGAPGHTPLGLGPGTILDYGPGPTMKTIRVGPSMNGSEEQTTLAADSADSSALWAGNEDSKTVREIDRSLGRTLMTIRGIAPGGLASVGNAAGDTVWASDPSRSLVARIDEHVRGIVERIRIPDHPTRLVANGQAVWVITSGPKHSLWRIDAKTNTPAVRIPLQITPKRVALGAGSVWVTGYRWSNHIDGSKGGIVIRIDPNNDRIVARIQLGNVAADGIIVSHGLVWVAVPPSA